MSTATLPPLTAGERLTQAVFHARYAAMPENIRAELIDGVVFMSPLSDGHGDLDHNLAGWMFHYKRGTPGVRSVANVTTKLDAHSEVQPDAQMRIEESRGGRARVVDGFVVGPPELVVEIARSSRVHDLSVKKDLYERAGVREYLVVTIDPSEVHWFGREGDGPFQPIEPAADGSVCSRVFPGLWLDPAALFIEDLDRLVATLETGMATPEHAAFVARLQDPEQRS